MQAHTKVWHKVGVAVCDCRASAGCSVNSLLPFWSPYRRMCVNICRVDRAMLALNLQIGLLCVVCQQALPLVRPTIECQASCPQQLVACIWICCNSAAQCRVHASIDNGKLSPMDHGCDLPSLDAIDKVMHTKLQRSWLLRSGCVAARASVNEPPLYYLSADTAVCLVTACTARQQASRSPKNRWLVKSTTLSSRQRW